MTNNNASFFSHCAGGQNMGIVGALLKSKRRFRFPRFVVPISGHMRHRRHYALLWSVLLGIASGHAQDTAKIQSAKIIDQYVKAIGGPRTLSRIRTLSLEGSVTSSGEGDSGNYTLDTKLPNRYYSEVNIGGHGFIEVKKHTVTEATFFYLDGEEISTVVKRDGKPLSAAEQKKENENTQRRVEKIKAQRAKKDAKEEKAKAEGKPEKDEVEVGIEMFLRSCDFVNPRRERYRGQDALVFDFEANCDYKPRNWEEKIVQKLAGTILGRRKSTRRCAPGGLFRRRRQNCSRPARHYTERNQLRVRTGVRQQRSLAAHLPGSAPGCARPAIEGISPQRCDPLLRLQEIASGKGSLFRLSVEEER